MENLDREADELARRACGDISSNFCTVLGVDIAGATANVWLLTNQHPYYERYQVQFLLTDGIWSEVLMAGGFQPHTPSHILERALALEHKGK